MYNSFLLAFLLSAADPSPRTEVQHLLEKGNLALAEQTARGYVAQHEDSADAHYLLGYVLFKKIDPKNSLAEYTAGARYRKPGSYDLEVVASDYVLLKDYADADKWFSKAIEMDASNFSALYYLGRAKYNENRFDEAVTVFEQCLTHDLKNVKYEDNLGLSYEGLGRTADAEGAFRNAIEWDKTALVHDFGPYLDLGSLLVDGDDASGAVPYLVEAAAIAAKEFRVQVELGKAYLHTGQLDKAQGVLETAVGLEPGNAPSHFMLAQVYHKRGLLDKARHENETYSRLNREHSTEDK